MRTSHRSAPVRALATGVALALAMAASLAGSACGTDALGIDACRRIERFRCKAAPACNATFDVEACESFYRDACLHGIENADKAPGSSEVDECIDAINGVTACAQTGVTSMSGCTGVTLVASASPTMATCDVLMKKPELLSSCSFLVAPGEAATATTAGSGGSGGSGGSP